jgi:hypothetical protein
MAIPKLDEFVGHSISAQSSACVQRRCLTAFFSVKSALLPMRKFNRNAIVAMPEKRICDRETAKHFEL